MDGETPGPDPKEMGLTEQDLNIEKPETTAEKGVDIPTYSPDDQLKLKDDKDFLSVVGTEKTRAAREIDVSLREYYRDLENTGNLPGGIYTDTKADGGEGLEWAVKNTDSNIGRHYQGHGLAKNPVEGLDNLIKEGVSKDRTLYSMSFIHSPEAEGALGADMPKTEGGIIVLSDYDKRFPYEGDPQIKYILVDEQYMRVVDIMQERYAEHGVKVVPWHDVPKVLSEDFHTHNPEKESQQTPSFDPENPPKYDFGPVKTPDLYKPSPDNVVQTTPRNEGGPDDPVW